MRYRSKGMDIEDAVNIPSVDYSHTESTVDLTPQQYREEMVQAAREGDLEASRLCQQKGWEYDEHVPSVIADIDAERAWTRTGSRNGEHALKVGQCIRVGIHPAHVWTPPTEVDTQYYCRGVE